MTFKRIILFTQPDCPPCTIVKKYLTFYGYYFEEYDISKDPKAREKLLTEYQSYTTPTVVVAGEVVRGFDLEKLESLLKKE